MCFHHAVLLASVQPGDTCMRGKATEGQSSALCWDAKPQVLSEVQRHHSPSCCPWRSGGSEARQPQQYAPVPHSDIPTGRAAALSEQGQVDPRRLKTALKQALPFFLPPIGKKGLRQASAACFIGVWPGLFQHLGLPGELPSQRWAACPRDNPWSCFGWS